VNQEVTNFNRQIRKIMELQSKVKILELNLDRNCFTTHGLYLNTKVKKLVSQDLALLAQQLFNEEQILSTISIPRKAPPVTRSDSESQDIKINDETNKLASSDSESQDVKINNVTNKLVFPSSSDSESQDIKINDETNKLTSSGSESQDVKINDETNKLASSDSESQHVKINNKTHKKAFSSHHRRNCPARRNPDFLWT
jgi:hypothetical protein